jgi:alpha-2-macroglobulin-like protein
MNLPEPNFSPAERDRLEQELLELHFGCHEDPAALEARLAAEPELRALQQQVLAQATLLEQAVRPAQPPLDLRTPKIEKRRPTWRSWRSLRSPIGRIAAIATLAATAVLGFFVAERISSARVDAFASEHLHLTVSAPRAVPIGAPWSFTVQAQNLRGEPAAARVRWQAFGEHDAVLASEEVALTEGSHTVAMPGNVQVPSRIEVVASCATDEVRQVLPLLSATAGPLVHVTTDRPVYRPGEQVFTRVVVLDRVTLLPVKLTQAESIYARLLDAKGAAVDTQADMLIAGVGSFAFTVPPQSAGGTHRVEILSQQNTFAPESLDIVVRPLQRQQLKKSIVLDRMSYAPGAHGSAAITIERMGGGMAAGAAAKGSLVIDGDEVWSDTQVIDADGHAQFGFAVPKDIKKGAARFVAAITDGGIVETEIKPFVVPTGKVLVVGFPEGGELVADVENGLYLECSDPLGRPVDTTGVLLDDRGEVVTKFLTAHQGRVKLAFVPRRERSYSVQIPGQEPVALSPVLTAGLALQLPGDEVAADAPVRLHVAGRGNGPWVLGVFCRGALVGQTTLRADDRGELRVAAEVSLPASAVGVLRATIFDRNHEPVAERLLRRALGHRVQVDFECAHPSLLPGERQSVTVRTHDEHGAPIAAVVGLGVTDLAIASLGNEPRIGLFDSASLFADVERVENLGDFLAGTNEAPRNADLLLGTRGWRRFVWRNDDHAKKVIEAQGPIAANVLAREGFSQSPQVASNLAAAEAAGQGLRSAAWNAERKLHDVALGALVTLLGWLLLEGLVIGQRMARRGSPLPLLAAAVLLIGLAWTAMSQSVIGSEAAPQQELADFEAPELLIEHYIQDIGRARLKAISAIDAGETWGDFSARLQLPRGAGGLNDRGIAGAFFNDGGDGDIRGIPGPNLRLAVPGDDRPLFQEVEEALVDLPRTARQYAHQHVEHDNRSDFAPTIYWDSRIATDANGNATVAFDTSDAVTTWLVQADAHVADGPTGRVGQGQATFQTKLPFHLEAKLPDELTLGDTLDLPIAAILEGSALEAIDLRVRCGAGLLIRGTAPTRIALENGRGRVLLPISADGTADTAKLVIEGQAGRFTDRVEHTLHIAPRGFPHRRSAGGSIANGKPGTLQVAIPLDAVPGSGHVTVSLFPSPIAALTQGLQGILREPCGCFEQASSSNYPNTLVLTLLDASGDDVPAVAARARELLPRGYSKITGYECKERGYEWFGGDPGHEALTAYGLLQFHDMAKVYAVDAGMIGRTQNWLLARRDGKGGYLRNARALDQFGAAPEPITDAYVTYALLQAGTPASTLRKEIEALVARMTTQDPYELALISCALQLAGRPEAAQTRQSLIALQQTDGSLHGTTTSITHSGGQDLIVETTGFAVLAWLTDPSCHAQMLHAVQFLQSCRSASGTFGATQATIAALRALTAYAQNHRTMREPGTLRIFEGEQMLAERSFAAGTVDAVQIELWSVLTPGAHTLRLELQGGGGELPWAGDVAYHADQPADDPDSKLSIRASLRTAKVTEGDTVALDVEIENRTAEGLPMAMAIVGLPAGLDLPTRVLEDQKKQDAFAFWELRGRELAIYWRDLAPEQKHHLTLDLTARIPGRSSGPASRTYLYYTPQTKQWAAPVTIEVAPR